jgi:hypothetical protein
MRTSFCESFVNDRVSLVLSWFVMRSSFECGDIVFACIKEGKRSKESDNNDIVKIMFFNFICKLLR